MKESYKLSDVVEGEAIYFNLATLKFEPFILGALNNFFENFSLYCLKYN